MTTKTVLFNPYTGTPRHPLDIRSDPEGILILEPDAPVRAYKPAQPDCRTCKWKFYGDILDCICSLSCVNGDKYEEATKVVLWRTE